MSTRLTIKVNYKKEHILAIYRTGRQKFWDRENLQQDILPILITGGVALFFTYKADTDYATGYVLGILLFTAAFLLLTINALFERWAQLQENRAIYKYAKELDQKTEVVECTDSTISVIMEDRTAIVKWENISYADIAGNFILLKTENLYCLLPAASMSRSDFDAIAGYVRGKVTGATITS